MPNTHTHTHRHTDRQTTLRVTSVRIGRLIIQNIIAIYFNSSKLLIIVSGCHFLGDTVRLPMQTAVVGFGFVCLSECLSSPYLRNRWSYDHQTRLDIEMFHYESWKPIYLRVKWSKVKFTRHKKNNAGEGFCALVSSGFFWLLLWRQIESYRLGTIRGIGPHTKSHTELGRSHSSRGRAEVDKRRTMSIQLISWHFASVSVVVVVVVIVFTAHK